MNSITGTGNIELRMFTNLRIEMKYFFLLLILPFAPEGQNIGRKLTPKYL